MLNKYFVYDNFTISLNKPELLLVKEFEDLMSVEFNKSKEDPKGLLKLKAFKVFKYLFLLYDHASPYCEENQESRKLYALQDSGLDEKDLMDNILLKASIKYEILTKSRLSKMLEAAQIAVDKFTLYFHTVDYTKIDEVTGKPQFNIKDGISSIANLGKLIDGLNDLKEQVQKEQEADNILRGGMQRGFLDR